jgi:hypothetical protein
LQSDPDRTVHAAPLSKTTLLKTHQQLQSARRNNYYKFVHFTTFLFCFLLRALIKFTLSARHGRNRQHKLLSQDEDGNLQPALGENALPEYVPCHHPGLPCTVENGCICAKKGMVRLREGPDFLRWLTADLTPPCCRCVRSFAAALANAKIDGLAAPASEANARQGHARALPLG